MSNGLYDAGRNAFARGEVAWKASGGSDIRAVLVDTANYVVNLTTHTSLANIPSIARVATASMTLLDPVAGVCDAQDTTFAGVTGPSYEAIVIYKHTGTDATATLIAYIDTATGLPLVPSGSANTIVWSEGAFKIFRI